MVYGNLAAELNQEVSLEDKTNVQRIYKMCIRDRNSSADSGGSRVAEEKQVDIFAFHINQREETINLNGISGAVMATTNMQMQTFVAEGMRKFESAEKEEECLCLNDQGGERMDVSVDVTATLRAGKMCIRDRSG